MDVKKLFLQIVSILLIMVVIACVGTAIKRSGEPDKEYDFSEHDNSFGTENWDDTENANTEDTTESTENTENTEGDAPVVDVPETKILYTTEAVNVRKEPSRNADWVGRLDKGASITAVGDVENEWQQVVFEGQTAYIKAEYLSTSPYGGTTDNTPTTPPSTPSQPTTPPSTPSQPTTPPSTPSQPTTPPSTGDTGAGNEGDTGAGDTDTGNEGDTGAGDTDTGNEGDTGAGDVGTGNEGDTGAGDAGTGSEGDTGAGNEGDTGAGNEGDTSTGSEDESDSESQPTTEEIEE